MLIYHQNAPFIIIRPIASNFHQFRQDSSVDIMHEAVFRIQVPEDCVNVVEDNNKPVGGLPRVDNRCNFYSNLTGAVSKPASG